MSLVVPSISNEQKRKEILPHIRFKKRKSYFEAFKMTRFEEIQRLFTFGIHNMLVSRTNTPTGQECHSVSKKSNAFWCLLDLSLHLMKVQSYQLSPKFIKKKLSYPSGIPPILRGIQFYIFFFKNEWES